jgi:putative flippase GtrA
MPPHKSGAAALERVMALSKSLRRMTGFRFAAFCVAGTFGFIADVAVLWLVLDHLGLYFGRVVSFMVAVTVTWIVNRHLAFRDRRAAARSREWLRYVAANSSGAVLNYGTYALMVSTLPLAAAYPYLGVAAGSIVGLAFNFTASNFLVFRRRVPEPGAEDR